MKRLLSIALFAGLSINLFAANITTALPKKCEAFRPDALYTALLTEKTANALVKSGDYGQRNSSRGEDGHEFWVVYSDRKDNPTYVAPNSKTVYGKLGFNEKVRIAQIKDGWALVYFEPKEQEIYPKFSGNIEWKGWIKMDKLLLWTSCPANDKGIYNKAMICANIDEFGGSDSESQLGWVYKNPENPKDRQSAMVDFTYYFVMKKEGNMVLLSHQNTMDMNNAITDQVLYGWVNKNSFVAWNQRSCLEPNWNIDDVEYFSKNGVKVNIYDNKEMTNKASFITFQERPKDGGKFRADMYRMPGTELRYPILDDNRKDAWNCSTFSSPGGGAINVNPYNEKDKIIQENLEELSKLNVIFVMDGTRSMAPFYPAVKKTIKEMKSYFPASWGVKVGFLIYRDKADGKYVTEMVPFTNPDNDKLSAWLDRGGEYGIKSGPGDKTMDEALYYGINKALDSFNLKPRESNIMFVIGDCGDAGDYPEITEESLVKKIVDKNVTLMGFQVRNNNTNSSFSWFNSNISGLILKSLQAKYNALVKELKTKGGVTVNVKMKKNEFEFSNTAMNAEGNLFIGSHKFVPSGEMNINELEALITTEVTKIKADIQHKIDLINNSGNRGTGFVYGGAPTGPQLDEGWLKNRLGEKFDLIRSKNTTVSFRGYTPKKDSGDHDFYKTVIFISQQELNTMMTRLAPLYEVAQRKGDDREPYVKAMRALVQAMIPNITDAEMNAKGYDEVMSMVAGLNVQTVSFKGRTITEVASKKAVPANEYQTIINKFKRQYQKIQRIQKQPYAFVREINGAKYYWIPTDDLP